MMFCALYGELKLTGNRMPKQRAAPIAMSEYPEKSKYNWQVYANAPPQAIKKSIGSARLAAVKTGDAYGAMPSASNDFLSSPIKNIVSPTATSWPAAHEPGRANCGAISLYRRIGPATRRGKNETNNA